MTVVTKLIYAQHLCLAKGAGGGTGIGQTHRQTDIATRRLNRPRAPISENTKNLVTPLNVCIIILLLNAV